MTDDGWFDERVAATYDARHGGTDPEEVAATVGLLAELAAGGPALEFAIGTGRIALPLQQRGIDVHGIELSNAMVEKMRGKPGGTELDVTIGDMAHTRVPGQYSLVYLVFNTLHNLTSQDAQLACFRNAAAHLSPGGHFLVEAGLPPLHQLPPGETRIAFDCGDDHWGIDEYDVSRQSMTSHHVWFEDDQAERLSIPFRYAWPSELDLMARIAGLHLAKRWEDWLKTPFSITSTRHISVWKRPAS